MLQNSILKLIGTVEETKTKICCYITIGWKPIVTWLSPSNIDNNYIRRHLWAYHWVEISISAHHKHVIRLHTALADVCCYSLNMVDGRVQFCRTHWYASGLWHIRWTLHWRLARWIKWRPCDVGEAKEGLENELWRRWSNGRVGEWVMT